MNRLHLLMFTAMATASEASALQAKRELGLDEDPSDPEGQPEPKEKPKETAEATFTPQSRGFLEEQRYVPPRRSVEPPAAPPMTTPHGHKAKSGILRDGSADKALMKAKEKNERKAQKRLKG